MKLHICGARGSFPVSGAAYQEFGQATTCFVLKQEQYAVVIDCGSGILNAKDLLQSCTKVDILLTHFHYDHIIGLLEIPPLLAAGAKVRIFSHFEGCSNKTPLSTFFSEPFWPADAARVQLCNAEPGETVQLHPDVSVSFRFSHHAEGALLFALQCWKKRICVVSDYEHGQDELSDWVRRCDLLIYDGTYTPEEYEAHRGWGHSTWEEGCQLAREGHAGHLLITHHSFCSDDVLLRQQEKRAEQCFPKVSFAREGTYLEF